MTHTRLLRFITLATTLLALTSCGKPPPPEDPRPVARPIPAPPVVTAEGGPYVLRYFSPTTGNLLVAKKVVDVPKGARAQVIVVPDDPKLQGPWLFVADISAEGGAATAAPATGAQATGGQATAAAGKDAPAKTAPAEDAAAATSQAAGQFPCRTVDRYAMERERAAEVAVAAASAAKAAPADDEVVLYKTAWCGYCKKAARYLELKGVAFQKRDLETDPGARADMMRRAKEVGYPASKLQGVPILYIKGHILSGFSREAIDAALKG